ncbi:DUF885 domain-containing protein [Joostella atrarenae]|uniref:DUF885 domain-containing protein n=1 Tax=Joostella atrarenae TaxID=679257 RepID=A0ABS9IZ88_9FLAO|nr:DUF885 domain-containing protein [Joostella atrarenae]MCF8713487.1 DUF885 domain-containing protein [Joostella atrarenae]
MIFKKYSLLFILTSTAFQFSCKTENTTDNSEALASVIQTVEDFKLYDRKDHPLGRYEKELFKKDAEFASEQLDKLKQIPLESLSETEQISWELLRFSLQNRIDKVTFEMYLNPIQADQGFHLDLNYRIKPILNYEDAKNYLAILNDIPHFVDQKIVLIREGIDKGMAQPKVIFKGYESSYNDHIVEDPILSPFYSPFEKLPGILTDAQKDSVLLAAKKAIRESVVPAFKKIKVFVESEYLPNTRAKIGVSETPNGKEFYQNRINYYTTSTEYTADEIHEIGLKEVARIKSEMKKIIEKVGFEGSFQDFLEFLRTDKQFYATSGRELLMVARDIAKRIDAELPKYFNTLPRKPYGVIKVPDAMAPKYTAGRYAGSLNKTTPGYYLVNTYNLESRPLYNLPALTAHEAVPGHHLQGSLNNELGDSIPQFRRNLYLSAYGEGWALYTESLADEMGIYTTPYEEFGKLTYEMWRACRLVVDTGIHAKGWTRDEVLDYMRSNTALSEHEINTETDRYIGWPGQAISYKIGELKIRELREKAEKALGADFDIREFHEVILAQGTVTLPILERNVNRYLKSKGV